MSGVFERTRTFRGAKVRLPSESQQIATATQPQVQLYSITGYDLAMSNRHKTWAKRWLRAHRLQTLL